MPQLFGYTRSSAFISPVPTTHWNSHQPGGDYYPHPKIALLSSLSSSDLGNFGFFLLFWFPVLLPTCCPMKAGVAALAAGLLGGTGVLFFLVAFGTDYWLLATETCGVFEHGNSTLQTGEVNSEILSYFGRIKLFKYIYIYFNFKKICDNIYAHWKRPANVKCQPEPTLKSKPAFPQYLAFWLKCI